MVKGDIIKDVSVDEIIQATAGGWNIFKQYSPVKVGKTMHTPWRKDENRSFGVFCKNGVYFYKDLALEEAGNSISFVAKLFNISYTDAVEKIKWDFNIGQGKNINTSPVQIVWNKPEEDAEYTHISFDSCKFKKKHHAFWNIAGASEEHCNKYQCWAVKKASVNRKRVYIAEDEIVFAYYVEGKGVKLYFPEREKGKKWRNNIEYHHLWNYENLVGCEKLIVQKSMKDLIITALFTPCVTATQAEAIKIFDDATVEKLNAISNDIYVFYGSDPDGVEKCKKITKQHGYKYINTPRNILPVNDIYGMASIKGIEEVERFLKLKRVI